MLKRTLLVLAACAMAWSMGCGEDDAPPPPEQIQIEVRNGRWQINVTTTYSGHDSCLARPPVTADTLDLICNVNLISGSGNFPLDCDVTQSDEDVSFDCTARINLGICWQIVDITGGGVVTDTTFDIDLTLTQRVTPQEPENAENCQLFYGRFVDACTTLVHSTGSWVDSVGAFRCPDDTLGKAVPFSRLLSRTLPPEVTGVLSP